MSVIFKTLQKLRGPAEEAPQWKPGGPGRRNAWTLRGVAAWVRGPIVLLALALALGMVVLWALPHFLGERRSGEVRRPSISTPPGEKTLPASPPGEANVQTRVPEAYPPPPPEIPAEGAEKGKLLMASSRGPQGEGQREDIRVVYSPPASARPVGSTPRVASETDRASESVRTPGSGEAGQGNLEGEGPFGGAAAGPPMAEPSGAGPVLGTEVPSRPSRGKTAEEGGSEQRAPREGHTAAPSEETGGRLMRSAPAVSDVSGQEKTLQVTRLIQQIQGAMRMDEGVRAERLLSELAAMKGEEHPYVLKLKGFWFIKQGDYATAASLLQRVIAMNGKDLDAGMNMAVLESRTGRKEGAIHRLRELRKIYPDDAVLGDLIRKIEG